MKRIKLTKGKVSIVDDDLFEYLNRFKWHASKNGNVFYARRAISMNPGYHGLYLHHIVIGFPLHKKQIDHINGDGLDNRRKNLRIVTQRQNLSNLKIHREGKTSSMYVGVYWHSPYKKWASKIRVNGKRIFLGYFTNEKRAGEAYQNKLMTL